MATAAVTYTFVNGTPADADEVNANFTDLVNFLNNSVVQIDASVAMTGILTLPASDPTTANQATRKAYVDARSVLGGVAVDTSQTSTNTSYEVFNPALSVSVATGTNVLVILSAKLSSNTANALVKMGYAVSGASTKAAADNHALIHTNQDNAIANYATQVSFVDYRTDLTAGTNVFAAWKSVSAGTGTFVNTRLAVLNAP